MTTTKRKRPAIGPKCECGGTLKPTQVSNFDFSKYSGIPSFLDGAPGWKCSSCAREILRGDVINASLVFIAMDIVQMPHRLSGPLARYLRRSMQITQQELADRMGIVRETVASWESNLKEISPQHDLILRVLMLNWARGSEALPEKFLVDMANEIMAKLQAVKSEPAPRKDVDLRVTGSAFARLPSSVLGRMNQPPPAHAH